MKKQEMRLAKARVRARKRRDKKRRKRISRITILGFLVLCFLISLLLHRSSAIEASKEVEVVLKVADAESIAGEEKPVFSAEAVTEGDEDVVLEEESGYTVASLIDELNRGIGYTLECEGNENREGTYAIKAELTSEITTPLYSEWFGKVKLTIENGKYTVKNKYGEWEDEMFKYWDGAYAKNTFITYQGRDYYFDGKGHKVTGWQEIEGSKYHFDKKGVKQTGWVEQGEDKYYLNEDGIMVNGWLRLDEDKYYFDKEGKMVTGEMKLGVARYVFAEDGKLEFSEGAVDPDKPMIALTFDDGPGKRTMELLEYMEDYNARATFFMLGQNVGKYESTVKKMAEIGCELGNHSYNHPNLANLSAAEVKEQINKTNQLVADASGQSVSVMRPPYGSINDTVKQNVGLPMILWSIDTLDWKTRNVDSTVQEVMNNVKDGDIILLHDIHSETVDAVKKLIPMLQEKGYQLVTVSEMAEARGITMEDGGRYGRFRKVE